MFWTYYFGRVVSLEIFYTLILAFSFSVQILPEKIGGELIDFINNNNNKNKNKT